MGLAGQGAGPGFAERDTRTCRRIGEKSVEAGAGNHKQTVGGPRAGDGESAEGGVELVQLIGP